MLHFAGGNCYSFQFMMPFLKDYTPIALELPGRGMRIKENLLSDFEEASKDIFDQLVKSSVTKEPFIIYGHSMGAYFALKITKMLEDIGKPPLCMVVTGNPGPGMDPNKERYLLTGQAFIQELQEMGGLPDELLQDQEVFKFFEPVIRADFKLAAEHRLENAIVVDTPIYAIMGDSEQCKDKITNWSKYTTNKFEYEILPGDHFFIRKHPQRIVECIKNTAAVAKQLKNMSTSA